MENMIKNLRKISSSKIYKNWIIFKQFNKKTKKKYKKTICYLSTFKKSILFIFSFHGQDMSFEEWYKIDRIIVNFLTEYCKEKKFKLKILGY